MSRVKVGDSAPDFNLPAFDGNSVSLIDFRGRKNIVLYFYPRDETPGCTREAKSFRDNYSAFVDLGAEVVGISSDDESSHRAFAEKCGIPFVLLSDLGGRVRKLFGATSGFGLLPARITYVIDKQGIVRHIFSSQLQPERHVQEALESLRKLSDQRLAER